MRNENIKLHSNIMKIFKYLVFVFAFFLIGVKVSSINIKATDYTYLFSLNDGSALISDKSDYNSRLGWRKPEKYEGSNLTDYADRVTVSDDSIKLRIVQATNSNPSTTTIYRHFYANGSSKSSRARSMIFFCKKGYLFKGDSTEDDKNCTKRVPVTIDNFKSENYEITIYSNGKITAYYNTDKCTSSFIWCTGYNEYKTITITENMYTDSNFGFSTIYNDVYKKGFNVYVASDADKTGAGRIIVYNYNGGFLYWNYEYDGNLTDTTVCAYNGSYCTNQTVKQTDWAKSHNVTITYSGAKKAEYCIGSGHPSEDYDCGGNRNGWKEFTSNGKITVGTTGYVYLKFDSKTFYVEKDKNAILFRVDKTAPTISYTEPSLATNEYVTSWAKSHSVSGISVTDSHSGVKSKQYCWWSTSSTTSPPDKDDCWKPISGTSVSNDNSMTGTYYLYLRAEDNAGNVATKVVSVTIQNCSSSGKVPGKDIYYETILGLKCTTVESYVNFKIDNKAPNKLDFVIDESEPSKKNASAKSHIVKIVASDEHSGMSKISYCWGTSNKLCDLVSWKDYSSVKKANEDLVTDQILLGLKHTGTAYLTAIAYDNVEENKKNSTSSSIELIFDNTAPTVDFKESINKTYIDDWHKKATLKILVEDKPSGILQIEYCFVENASEECSSLIRLETNSAVNVKEFYIPSPQESGRFYLKVKTYDRTYEGPNTETYTSAYQIKIDVDKPYLKPSFNISYDGSWAYNHKITFTLNDDDSKVSSAYYCFKKSNEDGSYNSSAPCIGKVSIGSGNHIVSTEKLESGRYYLYVYAIDSNIDTKNDFDTHTENVIKVDKTKPEIVFDKITYDGKWAYDHEITISVSDAHSGVSSASYCFKVSNKDGTYNSSAPCIGNMKAVANPVKTDQLGSEIYYLYVYAEDSNADRKNSYSTHTENVIKVDKTKPEIVFDKITYDGKWAYDHEITISVSDAHSGVSNAYYCFKKSNEDGTYNSSASCIGNMKTVSKPVSTRELGSGRYYLYVYAEDSNADTKNSRAVYTANVIKVDKTSPVIEFIRITEDGKWAKDHNVVVKVSDAHSGLSEIQYKWCEVGVTKELCENDERAWYIVSKINNEYPNGDYEISSVDNADTKGKLDGGYYLLVKAADDNADIKNSNSLNTKEIKFDNTAPILLNINNKELKNIENNKLLVKAWDEHTSVGKVQISWGTEIKDVEMSKDANGNYVYEFPKEVEGTIKVTLTLIDILGNKDIKEYEIEVDTVSIIAKDKDDNKLVTVPNLSIRRPSRVENKVNYEIEEMVDIEVEEDKAIVVVSEEVENIEVSVNEEEYKKLDNKVIELANSEVCVISIKFSYANEELKKLFVLNKKLNKWYIEK